MINPLGGLVGYGDDDDDEDVEEEEVEHQPETDAGARSQTPEAGALLPVSHSARSASKSPGVDSEDQDELYNDLVLPSSGAAAARPRAADGGDEPSPVGRADAVDAETDRATRSASASPMPKRAGGPLGDPQPSPLGAGRREAADEADPRLIVPEVSQQCPAWQQDWVHEILNRQRATGKQVLQVLRDNKAYRNPAFMEKMVEHYGVQQYGTSFPPDKFDTAALPEEDFYTALNQALEEKRAERKRQKMDEQRRMVQSVTASAMPASGSMSAAPAAPPSMTAVQRQIGQKGAAASAVGGASKRTKWDRV